MIQAEDRAHVHPMPAGELLAFLAQGFRLSPMVALPDIPGVDFDNQGEGLGGRPLTGGREALQPCAGVEPAQVGGASGLGPQALPVPLNWLDW